MVDDFFKWSISKNYKLDKILLCQATSPLLLKSEIDKTIGFIKKNKINSLFHVSEMIEHPYECIKGKNNSWKYLYKKNIVNRQNYEKFYFITGSLYFFTKKFFETHKKFYNLSSYAYKVDKINFVDVDTLFDLELANKIINLKTRN